MITFNISVYRYTIFAPFQCSEGGSSLYCLLHYNHSGGDGCRENASASYTGYHSSLGEPWPSTVSKSSRIMASSLCSYSV